MASEEKRNYGRVTDHGEEARIETAGRWTRSGYEAVPTRKSGPESIPNHPRCIPLYIMQTMSSRCSVIFVNGAIIPPKRPWQTCFGCSPPSAKHADISPVRLGPPLIIKDGPFYVWACATKQNAKTSFQAHKLQT
jgi:hypothetical protein